MDRADFRSLTNLKQHAHLPSEDLFIHKDAPWLPSLKKHLGNFETSPLWIDPESDVIYQYKLSSDRWLPSDTYYSILAHDRTSFQLLRRYSYNVFGAEHVDIFDIEEPFPVDTSRAAEKNDTESPFTFTLFNREYDIWDVVKGIVFILLIGLIDECYIYWKRTRQEQRETSERQQEREERKRRQSAFTQDMEKVEWFLQNNSFDKAKELLVRLKKQYPEFSRVIEERRKRVMEMQTQFFKETTRNNIPRP